MRWAYRVAHLSEIVQAYMRVVALELRDSSPATPPKGVRLGYRHWVMSELLSMFGSASGRADDEDCVARVVSGIPG